MPTYSLSFQIAFEGLATAAGQITPFGNFQYQTLILYGPDALISQTSEPSTAHATRFSSGIYVNNVVPGKLGLHLDIESGWDSYKTACASIAQKHKDTKDSTAAAAEMVAFLVGKGIFGGFYVCVYLVPELSWWKSWDAALQALVSNGALSQADAALVGQFQEELSSLSDSLHDWPILTISVPSSAVLPVLAIT
jgi:hypothetical protein